VADREKLKKTFERPIELLEKVVADDESAWETFVETYCRFLYSLAWRYARGDVDVASELVLVALEGLRKPDSDGQSFYRIRKYLQSMKKYSGRSRFTSWLALVAKNLFRDWFREHQGRRLLPKEIDQLDNISQDIFRQLFWEGFSEAEAYEWLKSRHPDLATADFDRRVIEIYQKLSQRNLWTIYQDLLRRLPPFSLNMPTAKKSSYLTEIADSNPFSRPDIWLQLSEERKIWQEVEYYLKQAIEELPSVTRNVVMMYIFRGMSGEEIQKVMGFRKRQRVYDEMVKAKRRIGRYLTQKGISADDFKRISGWFDLFLKKSD
jgi:RNA polymerase sigma factor (sigma-70 family)